MNRQWWLAAAAGGLVTLGTVAAYAQMNIGMCQQLFSNTTTPPTGFVGYHLIGPTSDPNNLPFGVGFDLGTTSSYTEQYALALERTNQDLVLANGSGNGLLRVRGDTGQLELGGQVGHPGTQQQVNVTAGSSGTPLTGVGVGTWGNAVGLYLYQKNPPASSLRTAVSFNNVYLMGSDSSGNGSTAVWWLWNGGDSHYVLTANADDSLTIKGGLQHTGSTLGFYGATPTTKLAVTGCRSDGTALASLISQLSKLGLLSDQTTP